MTGLPSVTLKLATSLDGRIATHTGESRWITGPEARLEGHRLRASHDAVLVGAETALADDPELTARLTPAPQRQPLRVVLDSHLRLPPEAKLARTSGAGPVAALCRSDADPAARARLTVAGVTVIKIPADAEGLDPAAALAALAERFQVGSVLIEGGGAVSAAFLRAGLVRRLEWFRAPLLLGSEGRAGIGPLRLAALGEVPRWRRLAVRIVGDDIWESYKDAG